jgi:hypothetical protein
MSKIAGVITGDLVRSSKLETRDFQNVIKSIKSTFTIINEQILQGTGHLELFRGDEFQIFLEGPEKALKVAILLRASLRSYQPLSQDNSENTPKLKKAIQAAYTDARIAIGIGTYKYVENTIVESQGEVFVNSGHAFDAMKKLGERLTVKTPWEETNKELKTECRLADEIINKWTPTVAKIMYHTLSLDKDTLKYNNQKEIAKEIKKTQPYVSKAQRFYAGKNGIDSFLERYDELIRRNAN